MTSGGSLVMKDDMAADDSCCSPKTPLLMKDEMKTTSGICFGSAGVRRPGVYNDH